jgi:hypothetical protein
MQKKKDLGFSGTVERLKLEDIIQMACVGGSTSTITASRGIRRDISTSAAGIRGMPVPPG